VRMRHGRKECIQQTGLRGGRGQRTMIEFSPVPIRRQGQRRHVRVLVSICPGLTSLGTGLGCQRGGAVYRRYLDIRPSYSGGVGEKEAGGLELRRLIKPPVVAASNELLQCQEG